MNLLSKNADYSWICMKISFSFIWIVIMIIMINNVEKCLYPTGICKLYSFEVYFSYIGKIILKSLCFLLLIAYLAEFKMFYTTLMLSALSIVIITFHESNGIYFRATILSLVWLAQCIAYFQALCNESFKLKYFRVQYACQAIAAVYILAAIAKIKASGIYWGNDAEGFALQVAKNYIFQYFDIGSEMLFIKAKKLATFFASYQYITSIMLYIALFLELFCFTALFNNKLKTFWAFGLIFMHIGIAVFMGIGISVIFFPMVIFFLNPLYCLVNVVIYVKNKFVLF